MAKVNFTASRINEFKCPDDKQQVFMWDARSPGLGLRATANGAKSYIFQGKIHGRSVRVTIGDTRSWGIDQAQEEARRLQRMIDDGTDPRQHRVEQAAAEEMRRVELRRQDITVGEVWETYLIARRCKWSERHYLDHLQLAEPGGREAQKGKRAITAGPLAPLMTWKLPELTVGKVSTWLDTEIQNRPARARLAFSALRAFINWCETQQEFAGMASADICDSRALRELIPQAQTKEDCLQREQLPAWFAAVRGLPNLTLSVYLQALLITGARREEMAGLRWDDVDFKWRSLSIADKVEESGRTIPLPPYLASQLLRLKELNETPPSRRIQEKLRAQGKSWEPSPWVFASKTSADGKIAEPRLAHNQAIAAAGIPHLTLHGLRRSFGTLAEWIECPAGVVAQIMGHKPSAIAEKHYRRRPIDLLRMWHDQIEAWMLEQAHFTDESPTNE